MAINNPQAVKFCNEKIRVAADKLAQAYNFAKDTLNEWYALNMGNQFPVDGGEIEDGSNIDGRPIITGNSVQLLMSRVQELVNDYEAGRKAKLNTVLQVSVNPRG